MLASKLSQTYTPTGLTVAVIGTGYVGLTTGACFAKLGHSVICADIIPAKVASLKRGEIPILEDGLEELVREGLDNGRLSFVLGAAEAAKECDFAFMCLPTPQDDDGSADLSYLLTAASQIASVLPAGAIVVNKSTVPVGSAQRVALALQRGDVQVASNPEFLREGTAVHDFFHPDRVVLGGSTPEVTARLALLYKPIDAPILCESTATAELIKYASNSFLATKISFANSISNLCEAVGADAHEVLRGMGYDERIGKKFLNPGPGWGGSCFPKDVYALIKSAEDAGYEFNLLKAVIDANDVQTDLMIQKLSDLLDGKIAGATIAAWGLAFKAGTDDTRQSPAIRIIDHLVELGATVRAYDPGTSRPLDGVEVCSNALSTCEGADILVVLTEWPEFANVPLRDVASRLANKRLLDTRNIISIDELEKYGFTYSSVGHAKN